MINLRGNGRLQMRFSPKFIFLTGLFLLFPSSVYAGPTVAEAIAKAERFSYDSLSPLVRNASMQVDWLQGDRYFHYRTEDSLGVHHYVVDTGKWKKRELFDPKALSGRIAGLLKNEREGVAPREYAADEPLTVYSLTFEDGNPFRFEFGWHGHRFRYDVRKDSLEMVLEREVRNLPKIKNEWYKSYSADSLYYISAIGHDLVLYSDGGRDSLRLTYDGEQYFSFAIGGDSRKEPDARYAPIGTWIGSTHKFFLIREDKREVGTMSLINSLSTPRPTVKTYKYTLPGDKHVPQYDVYMVDAEQKSIRRIDADAYPDQRIVVPRFSRFFQTDRYIYFIRMNRQADVVDLCRVDAEDGSLKVLISEECKPHLNEQLFSFYVMDEGEEILWWSERTGKGMYYLYDGEGRLKNAITDEDFVAGRVVRIFRKTREVIFEGFGREKGVNPAYTFYYKASLDGNRKTVCLTPGDGEHRMTLSPDFRFLHDEMSRMDLPPQNRIYDLSGREKFRMEDCDVSRLYRRGWKEPLLMKLHAADSLTDLYGIVYLPFDLDTTKKYPIISSVYPGPQTDLVPNAFSLDDNYNQSLAQMGFVVVNFSYRGSNPFRGRDFSNFGYGNLRDYPLDDDYAVIRQIGEKFPFADTTRVGIYGHSGGGFMTATAMMTRPDFYKVGVAASGNYDNNIYMQWWGESYQGLQSETAEDGSVVFRCDVPVTADLAPNLKGRLLLITGDVDNNVHPASTLRLARALIRAGKYFDMMILPGEDHGLGDKYYVNLIRLYFAEHLLGMSADDINDY